MSKVIVKETRVIVWTLTCKSENLSGLESPMVFRITCLNDFEILIGRKSPGHVAEKDRWISALRLNGEVRAVLVKKTFLVGRSK